VFVVVDVGTHGHNFGDLPVFGDGRRHENGQIAVAGEFTAAADAVHDIHAE
jgi:hypothetical protein